MSHEDRVTNMVDDSIYYQDLLISQQSDRTVPQSYEQVHIPVSYKCGKSKMQTNM